MKTIQILGTCQIVGMPKRTLAYIRNVGPYMGNTDLFERLFQSVLAWAAPKGFLQKPGVESISVYHDDPYAVPQEKQRISVGFTVPNGTKGEGDIDILELPEGNYVIGSFEIDPEEYGAAWAEIMNFIQENKLKPASQGPVYESYKNDPRQHPAGKHIVDIGVKLG